MWYPDVYADNERQIVKCRAGFGDFYLVDVGAFGVGTIVQTYSGDRHAKGEEKDFFKFALQSVPAALAGLANRASQAERKRVPNGTRTGPVLAK